MATQNISIQADLRVDNTQANKAVNDTTKRVEKLKAEAKSINTGGSYAASKAKTVTDDSAEYRIARGGRGTGAKGRDFARQAQGLGGLVHVYATLAANIFAVSAAFNALKKAADVTNMIEGLNQLGAASGKNLGYMAKQIVTLSDGALSLKDAMEATAQTTAAGLSTEQVERMTKVAKSASQALGRDMSDALSRLSRGITKVEPELLDELGIMVRVDKAAADYARTLGKTATALTDFERRQALAIAVLKQGEEKFNVINIDSNPYNKLFASFTNIMVVGGQLLNTILTPIAKILAEYPTALGTVIASFAGMLLSKAIPAISQWRKGVIEAASVAQEKAKVLHENLQTFQVTKQIDMMEEHKAAAKALRAESLKLIDNDNLFGKNSKIYQAFNDPTADIAKEEPKVTARIKKIESSIESLRNAQKSLNLANIEEVETNKAAIATLEKKRIEYIALASNIRAETAELQNELNVETKAQHMSFEETLSQRLLNKAVKNSALKTISASVVSDTENKGIEAAWKNISTNIQKHNDSIGTSVEKTSQKIGKLGSLYLHATGVMKIFATTAMTMIAAFSEIFIIVGAVAAGFAVLDTWLTKNEKQQKRFSESLDRSKESLDNTARTLDQINKKELLEQISLSSITAKANAFKELSDSLYELHSSFIELEKSQSGWSKFWDSISKVWGGSNKQKFDKGFRDLVADSINNLPTGDLGEHYKYQLADILGLQDISKLSKESINNAKLSEADTVKLVEWYKKISAEGVRSVNNMKSALDSLTDASKNYDNLVNSLSPSDNMSKYALSAAKGFSELTKSIITSADSMTALKEVASDFSKLKLLPTKEAENIAKSYTLIEEQYNKLQKLEDQRNLNNKQVNTAQSGLDKTVLDATRGGLSSVLTTSDDVTKAVALLNKAKVELEKTNKEYESQKKVVDNLSKGLSSDVISAFDKGSKNAVEQLSTGLNTAMARAALSYQSAILNGLDNPAAIKQQADIKKQELDLGIRQLKANFDLIVSQEKLRLVMDNLTLEQKKNESTTSPEAKKLIEGLIEKNTGAYDFISGLNSTNIGGTKVNDLKNKALEHPQLLNVYAARLGLSEQEGAIGTQKKGIDLDRELQLVTVKAKYTKEDLAHDNKKLQNKLSELSYQKQLSGLYNQAREDEISSLQDKIASNKLKEADANITQIIENKEQRIAAANKIKNEKQRESTLYSINEWYSRNKTLALREKELLIEDQTLEKEQRSLNLIEDKYTSMKKYLDSYLKLTDIQTNSINRQKEAGNILESDAIKQQSQLDILKETADIRLDIKKLDEQSANLALQGKDISGLLEQKHLLEANVFLISKKIEIEAEYQTALVKTEETLRNSERYGAYNDNYFTAIEQDFKNKVIETAKTAKSAASVLTQGVIDALDSTIDNFFELMQQSKLTFSDIITTLRNGLSDAFRDAASQTLKNAWKDMFRNLGIESSAEKAARVAQEKTDQLKETIAFQFPELKKSIDALTVAMGGDVPIADNGSTDKLKQAGSTQLIAGDKQESASNKYLEGTIGFKESIEKLLSGQMSIFQFATNSFQRVFGYLLTGLSAVFSMGSSTSSGTGILGALLNSVVGAFTGTQSPAPVADAVIKTIGTPVASNFDAWGLPYAKGGVFNSPSLSAHSNTIVTSPTMFAYAKGAGLMGEAGPEAIMPLKRDAQGNLGIRANGTGNIENNVSIHINLENGQVTQDSNNASNLAGQLGAAIKSVVNQELIKQTRPGGLLAR